MLCLSVIQSRAFFRHLVCPATRCLFFYSAESGFLMWSIYNAHRGEHPLPLAFSCLLSRLGAFLSWLDVFWAIDSYASLCYNVCGIKSQSTPFVWAPLSPGARFFLLLTAYPRFDTIIMCYGFVFHHSIPPVTCPPQVTKQRRSVSLLSDSPLLRRAPLYFFCPHHLLVRMHQLLIPNQEPWLHLITRSMDFWCSGLTLSVSCVLLPTICKQN